MIHLMIWRQIPGIFVGKGRPTSAYLSPLKPKVYQATQPMSRGSSR